MSNRVCFAKLAVLSMSVAVAAAIGCGGGSGSGSGGGGATGEGGSAPGGGAGGETAPGGSITPVAGVVLHDGDTLKTPPVEITAPAGSLVNDVTITVRTISPPPGLPPGFIPNDTAVDIEVQDQASISLPLLIKLYYGGTALDTAANANAAMAVLHYDSQDGYEPVTMLGRDRVEKYVLFEGYAFSPCVLGVIDEPNLPPQWPLAAGPVFSPIENGWPIQNFGDANGGSPFSPDGNCLGMSAYAVWFYQNKTNSLSSYFPHSPWPPAKVPPATDDSQNPHVSVAHLTAIRAHQAQSEYWALIQRHYNLVPCLQPGGTCHLNSKDRSVVMKYALAWQWDKGIATPQVLGMTGTSNKTPVGDGGVLGIGHATVLYRYDTNTFYFYEVNDAKDQPPRCQPFSTDCQEHSITFDSTAADGGAFSTYTNTAGTFDRFWAIMTPNWTRLGSFPNFTAEATQTGGAFTQSGLLTIKEPQAKATVPVGPIMITGSTTLYASAKLYAYLNGGARITLEASANSLSLSAQAIEGRNVLILLGGSAWMKDGKVDNWTGATLVREFYACPAGQTWNPNAQPPACATAIPPTFVSVSAGGVHACAVRTDSTVACWGAGRAPDNYGQATPPAGTFASVSAGTWHTCGVKTDGTIACWGDKYCQARVDGTPPCWGGNVYGQATPPAGTFASVSAGSSHTCGVKTDGTIACWGDNSSGQSTPPAGTFTSVSAGGGSCGVKTDGTVACWGKVGYVGPPRGITFASVSSCSDGSCGVKTDGTIACWGSYGPLISPLPVGTFSSVSVGSGFACAVRPDGTVACWGDNGYGCATPPAGTFISVSAGGIGPFACGVKTDGTIACWGDNDNGQCTPPAM